MNAIAVLFKTLLLVAVAIGVYAGLAAALGADGMTSDQIECGANTGKFCLFMLI